MKKTLFFILMTLTVVFSGCQSKALAGPVTPDPTITAAAEQKKLVLMVKIKAEALSQNLINESPYQELNVLLPSSYYDSEKRYPVVYYLQDFGNTQKSLADIKKATDAKMLESGMKEMIFIEVKGNNKLAGSFYTNSKVTGNWEDYLTRDVITYVDDHFRTLTDVSSRGIAGYAMGGYAAINLSLKHPDLFSSVYALSPNLFDPNGLKDAVPTWKQDFIKAYGAAFSPNTSLPFPHAEIPIFDNTDNDNLIISRWENGFGNLESKLADYRALGRPLNGICIKYGVYDQNKWIVNGCEYFSKLLRSAGIVHLLEANKDGHWIPENFPSNDLVPFFSNFLKAESVTQ